MNIKINTYLRVIIFCISLGNINCGSQVFHGIYGTNDVDRGKSAIQLSYGSYIIAGASGCTGSSQAYLMKLDERGEVMWTQNYGGPDIEFAVDIVQTSDGGFLLVGTTVQVTSLGYDLYLVKTNSIGGELWTKIIGGTDWDFAYCVIQTSDGGYMICGLTYSYGYGNSDGWVVKTDGNGNLQWQKTFGGSGADCFNSVYEMDDGGFIFTGSIHINGQKDAWLVRTSNNGTEMWSKTYDKMGFTDIGNSVIQTKDGKIAFTGSTTVANTDIWVVKVDDLNDGSIIWESVLGGNGDDVANSIIQELLNDNLLIAGTTSSFGVGKYDFIYYELSNTGQYIRSGTYGFSNTDICYSIAPALGGYILTGTTEGDLSYPIMEDIYIVRIDWYGTTASSIINHIDQSICH